jgi:hypothetical protein
VTEKVTHGSTGRRWKRANSMAALIYAPAGNCWDKLPRLRSTNAPRQRFTLLMRDAFGFGTQECTTDGRGNDSNRVRATGSERGTRAVAPCGRYLPTALCASGGVVGCC